MPAVRGEGADHQFLRGFIVALLSLTAQRYLDTAEGILPAPV